MNPTNKSIARNRNHRIQTARHFNAFSCRKYAVGSKAHPAEKMIMNTSQTWPDYLTTPEAAEYLRRSVNWVLCQKDIPYLPGHPNSYKRTDLDAWYEENKRKPLMG